MLTKQDSLADVNIYSFFLSLVVFLFFLLQKKREHLIARLLFSTFPPTFFPPKRESMMKNENDSWESVRWVFDVKVPRHDAWDILREYTVSRGSINKSNRMCFTRDYSNKDSPYFLLFNVDSTRRCSHIPPERDLCVELRWCGEAASDKTQESVPAAYNEIERENDDGERKSAEICYSRCFFQSKTFHRLLPPSLSFDLISSSQMIILTALLSLSSRCVVFVFLCHCRVRAVPLGLSTSLNLS